MSGEHLTAKELNNTTNIASFEKSGRSKVRQEKNKEKKENYIFLGLICGVVAVTGIIASF